MKDLCDEYFGNNIKIIHNKLDTYFTSKTSKLNSGLTNAQYVTLIYIYEAPDKRVLQKEIENKFELSHPTTVGIVKRLTTQNLVITQPYKENQRQKEVILTNDGIRLMTSIKPSPRGILESVDNHALQGFTDDEKKILYDYLLRINKNLNA